MQIGIVQFPGSNCERETMLAVRRAGMEPVEFLWNESHEKLRSLDGYIIVGGFSYEDRSRAGIIAALDPVMQEIMAQSELGKPVLGICNGAQILVETGLVPGLENHKIGMALAENKRMANGQVLGTGYYNNWVNIRLADHYQRNAFTRHLTPQDTLRVPVAHAEGRFVMTPALWQEIEINGLHVFQYCDSTGQMIDEFPVNPNGSWHNIAAIANKAGNVLAMMPHPERTKNGDAIFKSMHDYIADGRVQKVAPLAYYPRRTPIQTYQQPKDSFSCVVELIITDNQAMTVQNTLQQLGISVTVRRQVHWEIHTKDDTACQKVMQSGVLFNERKEVVAMAPSPPTPLPHAGEGGRTLPSPACGRGAGGEGAGVKMNQSSLLVRNKDDILGQQALQTLRHHFAIHHVDAIYHSVLWHFHCEDANIADLTDRILTTHIICNPYAHDYYHYS